MSNEKEEVVTKALQRLPRNLSFASRQSMYDDFTKHARSVGIWNISCKFAHEQWNIPKSTYCNWRDRYLKEQGEADLNVVGQQLLDSIRSNMRFAHLVQSKPENNMSHRLAAGDLLLRSAKAYLEVMESIGLKPKIAEKIEYTGANIQFIITDPNDKYPVIPTTAEGIGQADSPKTDKREAETVPVQP